MAQRKAGEAAPAAARGLDRLEVYSLTARGLLLALVVFLASSMVIG